MLIVILRSASVTAVGFLSLKTGIIIYSTLVNVCVDPLLPMESKSEIVQIVYAL